MNRDEIIKLFEDVKAGDVAVDDAVRRMEELPFRDMGISVIDSHRELRTGYPEVIYCEGKTPEQVKNIFRHMLEGNGNILATRAGRDKYEAVREICPEASYNELGRTIALKRREEKLTDSYIAIVCAGTSDLPVVEEAAETAMLFGNRVEKIVDVGVAGMHRLFSRMDVILGAKVIIVVAGMEGALATVLGGMVTKPIIAVPTSVGYGASFGGGGRPAFHAQQLRRRGQRCEH